MKRLFSVLALLLIYTPTWSQEVEMATGLRSSGKIYVVVAIISVIFLGIVIYLFSIDKRLKKLERKD